MECCLKHPLRYISLRDTGVLKSKTAYSTILMKNYDELCSMLELCFGDVDEAEGLAELHDQLEVYPDRAGPFLSELRQLNDQKDGDRCREILSEYAHFSATPEQSLEWFRWLQRELEDVGGRA